MSTVTTFVSSKTAAKAIDEKTLTVKSTCGLFLTMSFVDRETMKHLALEILRTVDGPTPDSPLAGNNAIGGSDGLAGLESLTIDPDAEDSLSSGNPDAEDSSSSGASATETHSSAVESSFESYSGGGMTQEVNF